MSRRDPFKRYKADDNWYSHELNTLFLSSSEDQIHDHEFNHFLVHAATPYGLFLQSLTDLQSRLVFDFVEQTDNAPETREVFVPLRAFRRHSSSKQKTVSWAPYEQHIQKYLYPCETAAKLRDIMEASAGEALDGITTAQAIAVLEEFEDFSAQRLSKTLSVRGEKDPLVSTWKSGLAAYADEPLMTPMLHWTPDLQIRAGATHVMEGLAQKIQEHFLNDAAEPDFDDPDAPTYWLLFLHTRMSYGTNWNKTEADYNRVYNTFIALCDLALFTPIGPHYRYLRSTHLKWSDIHPGSRFIKGLFATMKLNLWFDDFISGYQKFQDEICTAFRWPLVHDFLNVGQTLSPLLPQWKRHREACIARRNTGQPWLTFGYNNQPIHRQFLLDHFPFLYDVPKNQMVIRNRVPDEASTIVMHYALGHLSGFLLEGDGTASVLPAYEELFPDRLFAERECMQLPLRSQLAVDLVRLNPWLDRSRFKVLEGN